MSNAKALIAQLRLEPHPEGGWYRETWRAPTSDGQRAASTAIHFLLETGQSSHWHTVDAAEIWLWHQGNPVELLQAADDLAPVRTIRLGPDMANGDHLQHVIPADEWQAARPVAGQHDYSLVSCVVAPGFQFEGFTLAPAGWQPGEERRL